MGLYAQLLGLPIVKLELPVLLRYGRVVAEFFLDARIQPCVFHYTLSYQDGPEILHWGQEYSEQKAHLSARMVAHHFITRAENAA